MANQGSGGSLTDVRGVHVGHFTVDEGETQTGLTVILPYPHSVQHRKLFMAGASSGGGDWTGLEVAEDFGTFASPIVLCNATTVGIAYDALITRGHRRDPELPVDDGWPPVVIGMDDGHLNDLRRRRITHDDVLRALEQASSAPPARGSVGIGRGLCALGGKGGVGDAAARVSAAGADFTVGALVAANGGAAATSANGGAGAARALAPGFAVVLATDAPLFPEQLRALCEAALRGLDAAAPPLGVEARQALAFSTANAIEGSLGEAFRLYPARRLGEAALGTLLDAAAAVAREALDRALAAATAVTGRKGRKVEPVARRGSGAQ